VIRFSAMGDVAMCVPVVRALLMAYPDLQVTFLSQTAFAPLFSGIDRLHFHPADLKGLHKGMTGMLRLFRELKIMGPFDAVADLHQVLRSTQLDLLFRLCGWNVAVIHKGRREKKALTRRDHKQFQRLPSTFSRYADVFKRLSLPVTLEISPQITVRTASSSRQSVGGEIRLGIAPFAKHPGKTWPIERMRLVVESLSSRGDIRVLLFGGGKTERILLDAWAEEIPGVTSMAGRHSLKEELGIIAGLDLMVSMDSANMHLASMAGVPVVSIWGATHPYAGFLGWQQSEERVVQSDMDCRPCSVFGNKPCYKGTNACMTSITAEEVIKKILTTLSLD
jgi:ADP-heptose:LPS heptosyltransferase